MKLKLKNLYGARKRKTKKQTRSTVKVRTLTSGYLETTDNSIFLDGQVGEKDDRTSTTTTYPPSPLGSETLNDSCCETSSETSGSRTISSSDMFAADPVASAPNAIVPASPSLLPEPLPKHYIEELMEMVRTNPPPNQSSAEAYASFMKTKGILDDLMRSADITGGDNNEKDDEEDLEYFFRFTGAQTTTKEYESLKYILSGLTEEEKDIASKADYRFYRMARKQQLRGLPPSDLQLKAFEDAIMGQAERYLASKRGKQKAALEEFRKSLDFRKQMHINMIRFCFVDNPTSVFSMLGQAGVRRYIGDKARAVVLNYDEVGHANLYLTGRFNRWETRADLEGFLGSHGYMFERAIASTIHRTQGKLFMVNVVLDFNGFSRKNTQPMFMLTELLKLMNQQYPQRVNRAYLVDPPFVARIAYKLVKPIVAATGLAKEVIFVHGEKEREKHFGPGFHSKCTEGLDIEKFYQLPFHQTYCDAYPLEA